VFPFGNKGGTGKAIIADLCKGSLTARSSSCGDAESDANKAVGTPKSKTKRDDDSNPVTGAS